MEVTRQSFPVILKEKRQLKGISIRQLGREAGIDFSTISKMEKGEIGPTLDSAIRLAKVLNFSLDDASYPLLIDNSSSSKNNLENDFVTKVRFKFQSIKRGRKKNISKIAGPFHRCILTKGAVILLTGPEPRRKVMSGDQLDCLRLIETTSWALAISDAELFWIGTSDPSS